jgi:predicted ester cyclase
LKSLRRAKWTRKQNTQIFRRVIEEGFNRGNFDAWDECFPPTYEEHQYGLPPTLAGFKQAIAGLRRAIPDLSLTIDEMITSGDKVWVRMTARGTQSGPFMGFAPTGKPFAIASSMSADSRPEKSSSTGECPIDLRSCTSWV